jgi:hypothetical protein
MAKRSTEERDFQKGVLDLAALYSWIAYHTHDSRRSQAGFPDLVLVRDDRLIFAELKSEKGRATKEQEEWLGALCNVSGVSVYLWRPSDMDEIIELLKR